MRILAVIALAAILLLAFGVGYGASSRFKLAAETSQPVTCVPDDETREKIRAIMLDAMDEALKDHIVRLHEIWMRDETGQPARAVNGARRGIRAYVGGRIQALKWNPPTCQ